MNSEENNSGLFLVFCFMGLAIYAIYRKIFSNNKRKEKNRKHVNGYEEIGPYPVAVLKDLLRSRQNSLIDRTRKSLSITWFPCDFISSEPFRFQDNGHMISGAARDLARKTINTAIRSIGMENYEISPAKQSDPDAIVHRHYAPADLARPYQDDEITDNHIISGVDVDYYLTDINEWIGTGNPLIFYSFNPKAVSGKDGDSHFRINGSWVEYDVSGGNTWRHQVWDWCTPGEFIQARWTPRNAKEERSQWFWSWFGMEKVVYSKVAYTRPFKDNPHRILVHVIPEATHWQYNYIATDMHARKLERIDYTDYVRPGWNRLVYADQNNDLKISLGRVNNDHCITLPKEHYDMLMGSPTPQSLSSRMIGLKYTDPLLMGTFSQYFKGNEVEDAPIVRLGKESELRVHWPAASQIDAPEVSYRKYANPVVASNNFVPQIKRWEATSASIDARITFHHNGKTPGAQIEKYAAEFVKLLVPTPGIGVPFGYDRIAKELDKPAQVLAFKAVADTMDVPIRKLIDAFVKNEPCMKPGRMISAFADFRYIVNLSRFTLSFRNDVLHSEDNEFWFMPGKTPSKIAASVREYVSGIDEPVEGDFSNFDGTVSEWCQRVVMNAVYLRYFNNKYRQELHDMLKMLYDCPARSKVFGFRYEPGVGVKSGSPTTCDANTILNAFMMYSAIRRSRSDLEPEFAFRLIGLAFGDDQVFDWQYRSSLQKVVDKIGMKIKMERYDPKQGLCFLARVFIDPYTTDTTIQDPLRTWRKLHLTSRHIGIPTAEAAYDRVQGYLVTDALTPVTSNFCRAVARLYDKQCDHEKRNSRKSKNREKNYWFIHGEGCWPQSIEDVPLMKQVISSRTGFCLADIEKVSKEYDESTDVWSFPTLAGHEEVYDTVGTIGPDGEVDEDMDPRSMQYKQQLENVRLRANPSNTWRDERSSQSSNQRDQQASNGSINQTLSRPHRVRGVVAKDNKENDRQHTVVIEQAGPSRMVEDSTNANRRVRQRGGRKHKSIRPGLRQNPV